MAGESSKVHYFKAMLPSQENQLVVAREHALQALAKHVEFLVHEMLQYIPARALLDNDNPFFFLPMLSSMRRPTLLLYATMRVSTGLPSQIGSHSTLAASGCPLLLLARET